jgi:hypothetical protein
MDDLIISTNEASIISNTITNNTVQVTEVEPVLITNDNGSVITVGTESSVLVETQSPTLIVTGILGPPGVNGINEEDMVYSKRVDFVSDNELYKAEAAVGASESAAVWRIRKLSLGVDGDVTETWASGDAKFDKVWADRASLTYI